MKNLRSWFDWAAALFGIGVPIAGLMADWLFPERIPARVRTLEAYIALACIAWLMYAVSRRYRDWRNLAHQATLAPRVTLIGGSKSEELMGRIVNHPELQTNQHIVYSTIVIQSETDEASSRLQIDSYRRDILASSTIVLMQDVSPDKYPSSYRALVKLLPARTPIPVVRFYTRDYRGYPMRDYPEIPADMNTADDLVHRGAEFFLGRAVIRGWHLSSWRSLYRAIAAVAGAALLIVPMFLAPSFREYRALRSLSNPPADVTRRSDELSAKARNAVRSNNPLEFKEIARGRGQLIVDEIKRASSNGEGLTLHLFARETASSADQRARVRALAYVGTSVTEIDDVGLVGCVMRRHWTVYWSGKDGITSKLKGWSEDGMPMEADLEDPSKLAEDCRYKTVADGYPKTEFLCTDTWGDEGSQARGAICLLTNSEHPYLDTEWIRHYLEREAEWMNAMDPTAMVGPFQDP